MANPERGLGAKDLSQGVRMLSQAVCGRQLLRFVDARLIWRLPVELGIPSFWWSYRGGHTRSHPEHGS
jgi:hypothetical protein